MRPIAIVIHGKMFQREVPQLSGGLAWTYELFKVYGWVPGQKYPKTN